MPPVVLGTHPWIRFDFDFGRLDASHWLLLGECSSKIEHIVGTPLTAKVREELDRIYVSRGLQGTAAIEGNTLTEDQVRQRLGGRLSLPPSQENLGREIDNLSRAYELIRSGIDDEARQEITEEQIKEFNRIILEDLPLEEDVVPGEYARRQHGVARYRAPSPIEIREVLMPRLLQWVNSSDWHQIEGHRYAHAIIKAILAHLYLAWIHPFGDGNGRTARLIEADLLARAGVPAISYHLLSTHYAQTRAEYYRVLAESSAVSEGKPIAFLGYALQGFADGLRRQVEKIKQQHREIIWHDLVHAQFRGQNTARYVRLRRLAIDLAEMEEPVKRLDLRRVSPRVAEAYAGKTGKTLTRDLRELLRRRLIRKVGTGYLANVELLDSFVPPARKNIESESDEE